MSLFDRIAETLDRWLTPTATAHPVEEEKGHMALLRQSSEQSRATVDAILKGNLVAASSATVDGDVEALHRYEQWRDTVPRARSPAEMATLRPDHGSPFTERLNAEEPRGRDR